MMILSMKNMKSEATRILEKKMIKAYKISNLFRELSRLERRPQIQLRKG